MSVVGGEDTPGAEPYGRRQRGCVGGQNDGRERSDGRRVMVFGVPETQISEVLDAPGERGGVAQRVRGPGARLDHGHFERAERNSDHSVSIGIARQRQPP